MPFTHKILAYCESTKDLKDSEQREEKAHKAVELAKEFAVSISTAELTYRPIVHVEVIPASN